MNSFHFRNYVIAQSRQIEIFHSRNNEILNEPSRDLKFCVERAKSVIKILRFFKVSEDFQILKDFRLGEIFPL